MTIREKIHDFIHHCFKWNQEIGWIPLSKVELEEVYREDIRSAHHWKEPKYGEKMEAEVMGYKVWETEYAPAIMDRVKTIDLPVCRFSESMAVDLLSARIRKDEQAILGHLRYSMEHAICAEDTNITLTVICDPWRALKERFKWIGKRWPVRTQQFKVDGKVLYPYLNVTFPLNRHTVKWRVACI